MADTNISNLYSVVTPGQRSDQVKALQEALIGAGHNIAAGATGFFGPQTQAAVDAWKKTLSTPPITSPTQETPAPGASTFTMDNSGIKEPSSSLLGDYTSFDSIKKMMDEATTGVNATLVPTEMETKLKTQLADIVAKEDTINQGLKQYKNNLEGEGISSGAIQGRSEAQDRIAAFQLEPLALQEKNLLTRLGLESEARAIGEKIAENKLTNIKDLVTTAFQMQSRIDKQKTDLIASTDKMTDNTRQALSTILSQFKGIDFHSLSTESQLGIQKMANTLGIPIDVIVKGMEVNKNQQDFDNLLKKQQEARLASDSSGDGKNKPGDLKAEMDSELKKNNAFGQDGKVAWETYLWMSQNWINNGGTAATFAVNYPIGKYLNDDNQAEFRKAIGE